MNAPRPLSFPRRASRKRPQVYGAPADFGAPAAAAVVEDLVLASEAGAAAAAEACAYLQAARGDGRAAGDVLRELDRVAADGGGEAGSAKFVAGFVEALGAKAPAAALQHVATLKGHLASPHHGLRSAVVSAVANVLGADAVFLVWKFWRAPGASSLDARRGTAISSCS